MCIPDFEKKIVSKEDQLYAQVYPGVYNASENRLRFSDPNFSPYQDSNPSREGLSNPAYAPDSDNVDSVSQAAMRRQIQSNANDFGPQISGDSDSTTHRNLTDRHNSAVGPGLPFSDRPLPSTGIRSGSAHTDNDVAPPWSSNASSVSQPQGFRGPHSDAAQAIGRYLSPSEIALNVSSPALQDPNSNRIMVRMPYSSSPEKVTSGNQVEEPVIYYIRDANGHLAALVPSESVTRASLKSDASSSVVADHGPYSEALAHKKAMMRGQIPETLAISPHPPHTLIAMPVQTALTANTGAQHENLELQEMTQSQPRPHRSYSLAQAVAETPLSNNSPIHYASPVHNPVSGHGGGEVGGHQPLLYQDQAMAIPIGDPSVNHFRQNSDAYSKRDHSVAREDPMVSPDQLVRNAVSHISTTDMERDANKRHMEQPSTVPDVVSSNPSHSASEGNHSRNASEVGKAFEKPQELGKEVVYLQNAQGQQTSPITNV